MGYNNRLGDILKGEIDTVARPKAISNDSECKLKLLAAVVKLKDVNINIHPVAPNVVTPSDLRPSITLMSGGVVCSGPCLASHP
jgi:hypothetical protein